jgi:phospholipase/lecithinase/hemolysin
MTYRPAVALYFAALALALAANAAPFSAVVAYGDSLSDTGNFYRATGMPVFPYHAGRASNGPVAVEYLAAALGAPLMDLAWIGATTGIGNHLDPGGTTTSAGAIGLPGMKVAYMSSIAAISPIAASTLFLVWGGPDDFLSPSPLDTSLAETADRAVSNIVWIVDALQGLGARRVLVPGMPDLGLTPYYRSMGPVSAAEASLLTGYFNAQLAASLPTGAVYFDTAGLLREVVANPAQYGLLNVTGACLDQTPLTLCSAPDQYLFWDDLHPTTRGHQILAAELAAVVPEPSAWILPLSACALLILRHRR